MPRHVAVVMDGNGRWANQRGLPRTKGHEAGEAALLDVVAGAIEVGVTHLSAYAFSTENWKRSPDEVKFLMGFNRDVIRRRRDQLHEWGVRMRWVGRRPRLWGSVIKELEVAQELTRHNTGLTLYFCVNYGGRAEIGDAVQRLAEDVARGRLKPRSVDESTVARYLPEPDMPDVDLFVRSLGGAAHQQLPALAERLRRDGLPGPALARLRPARPVGRHPVLRRPRAPVRRGRRRPDGVAREPARASFPEPPPGDEPAGLACAQPRSGRRRGAAVMGARGFWARVLGAALVAAPLAAVATASPANAATTGVTSFSYVSQSGDYIGQGRSGTLSDPSQFRISGTAGLVTVGIDTGSEWWSVGLAAPRGQQLTTGTYENVTRAGFNTTYGGLDVSSTGRGCNEVKGRFTVHAISADTGRADHVARRHPDPVLRRQHRRAHGDRPVRRAGGRGARAHLLEPGHGGRPAGDPHRPGVAGHRRACRSSTGPP